MIKVSQESRAEATQGLESAGALDNKDMTKVDNSEFSSPLEAKSSDLAEAETCLAAVVTSMAASKNSCAHMTADKTLAEELKTLADAHRSFDQRPVPLRDTRIRCSRCALHCCAHDGEPQRTRRGDDDEASRPDGALCCSLSWSRVCMLS